MRPRLAAPALVAALCLATAGVYAQAEADRQVDAAIERLRTALGPDARITVGSRQTDPATGRTRLGDVTITWGGRRMTVAELWLAEVTPERLGRAEARGLREQTKDDQTEAARLLIVGMPLPAPGAAFDPAEISFERFELEGLRGGRPSEGNFTLGRVVAEGYQRASGTAPGRLRSGTMEGFNLESRTRDTPTMRVGRLAASDLVFPDFRAGDPDPRVFRAAELTVEGVALRDTGRDMEFALPRLSLRDWIPGRLADLAVEGLSASGDFGQGGPGRFRLGRITASGIDGATTLAAVLDNVQVPDPVAGQPQRMAVEGLEVEMNGAPLFALGRMAVEGTMDAARMANGAMLLEGLRVTLPRGTAPPLEAMGFREIAGSLESRASGSRDGGALRIDPIRIQWNQAGALTMLGDFDNVPTAAPGQRVDNAEMVARLAAARLIGMTLRYQDQGLVGRVLTQQAREQRMPEARLREQWAQMVLAMPIPGASAPPPPPARGAPAMGGGGKQKGVAAQPAAPQAVTPGADPFTPIRQALAQFIRRPGTLEVVVRPSQPIAVGELQGIGAAGPAQLVQRLGVSVRAD